MQIFYNPSIEAKPELNEEESRHCVQVLRHQTTDSIFVTDGMGKVFECYITLADKKKCVLKIVKVFEEQHREKIIHIAVAPTKQMEKMEWMLEKCTELGAASFTFIETEHSERTKVKTERLEKILVSAMKQSMNYFLPTLQAMVPFKEFIAGGREGEKFICYKDDKNPLTLFNQYHGSPEATILIGPEGNFTLEEVEKARKSGYSIASLGRYRLRTETACVSAVQQLMLK